MKIIAKAIIFDTDGRILVLRRSETHPRYPHHFDFPGGEVEEGELEVDAVVREIAEETGLQISVEGVARVYQRQVSPLLRHKVYKAKLSTLQPEVSTSWEHDDYEWFSTERLLDMPLPEKVDDYYESALLYLSQSRANQ